MVARKGHKSMLLLDAMHSHRSQICTYSWKGMYIRNSTPKLAISSENESINEPSILERR